MLRLNFDFVVNKTYLLIIALKYGHGKQLPFKRWIDLQNELWKKYEMGYKLLDGKLVGDLIEKWIAQKRSSKVAFENILNATKELDALLKEGLKTKEFFQLYKETQRYLQFVQEQWNKNKKETLQILWELTGLDAKRNFIVLITHPKIYNGMYYGKDIIAWGHPENWQNYTTVYLCHEALHALTEKNCQRPRLMHALIELATDNELRIRLNKKGAYFKEGKFNVGHKNLRELEKKILPHWQKYLKLKKRNIFRFEGRLIQAGVIS